jgi:hypothetical protein
MKSHVVPQTRAFSKRYRTKFAKFALELFKIRTVTLFVHIEICPQDMAFTTDVAAVVYVSMHHSLVVVQALAMCSCCT